MRFSYAGVLAVSLLGLSFLDWRYKLAWFDDARKTAGIFGLLLILFIVWDLAGIYLGIFSPGESRVVLGMQIVRGLPIEELGFLSLLIYTTLLIYRGIEARS